MREERQHNFLHIYGQYMWHDEAIIRGTPRALRALRDVIDRALEAGEAEGDFIATDGEGYAVKVMRSNLIAGVGQPEYRIDVEVEIGRRMAERFARNAQPETDWDHLDDAPAAPRKPVSA